MKKLRFTTYILLILSTGLLLFTACNDGEDKVDSHICPLETGNFWRFEQTYYVDFGDTVLVDHIETLTVTVGIETTLADYEVHEWLRSDHDTFTYYYTNLDDGLYEIGRYLSTTDVLTIWTEPLLLFKFPANSGDIFESFGANVEVIKTDTSITTNAGVFECFEYSSGTFSEAYRYYFSPDIGYIGTTRKNSGLIAWDRKLIEYNVSESQ